MHNFNLLTYNLSALPIFTTSQLLPWLTLFFWGLKNAHGNIRKMPGSPPGIGVFVTYHCYIQTRTVQFVGFGHITVIASIVIAGICFGHVLFLQVARTLGGVGLCIPTKNLGFD